MGREAKAPVHGSCCGTARGLQGSIGHSQVVAARVADPEVPQTRWAVSEVLPGEWPLCGHHQITVKDCIVYFVDEFDARRRPPLGWAGLGWVVGAGGSGCPDAGVISFQGEVVMVLRALIPPQGEAEYLRVELRSGVELGF